MLSSVPVSVEPAANSGTPAKSKRLFSITEVPFLVTVFIGLFCWSVTYFSDAIKKSPTVYYTKINSSHMGADGICFLYNLDSAAPNASRHSNQDWIGYEVTNLTRDQVFKDISFYIRATKGLSRILQRFRLRQQRSQTVLPSAPSCKGQLSHGIDCPNSTQVGSFNYVLILLGELPRIRKSFLITQIEAKSVKP